MDNLNEAYERIVQPKEFVKNFKTDEAFVEWLNKGTIEDILSVQEAFKGSGLRKHPKLIKKVLEERINNIEVEDTSLGLGDVVEKVTKATGIKKVVDAVSDALGVDCGCEERKAKWNKIRIFKKLNPECLNESEISYLRDYFDRAKSTIDVADQKELIKIYNRVFRRNQEMTSCVPCWNNVINNLKSVLSYY